MTMQKIAITIDEGLLEQLDELILAQRFPNRSRAIQEAVREQLSRLKRDRLARETAKLDRVSEQRLADEGLGDPNEWPEY
jgi:metal-responsive CopG/Arc/MetJ family transcriptional regulator